MKARNSGTDFSSQGADEEAFVIAMDERVGVATITTQLLDTYLRLDVSSGFSVRA
jgi:hypothetical protein